MSCPNAFVDLNFTKRKESFSHSGEENHEAINKFFPAFICCLLFSACNLSVNKNIYIDDGEKDNRGYTTVNGNITVGKNAEVGDCTTVNGRIEVGDGSKIKDMQTVNGGIRLDDNVQVDGNIIIEENNGSSSKRRGIRITITEDSVVKGDIIVKERDDLEVTVYLSNGGKVEGEIDRKAIVERS